MKNTSHEMKFEFCGIRHFRAHLPKNTSELIVFIYNHTYRNTQYSYSTILVNSPPTHALSRRNVGRRHGTTGANKRGNHIIGCNEGNELLLYGCMLMLNANWGTCSTLKLFRSIKGMKLKCISS